MNVPTIYEIQDATKYTSPYFFSKQTLRFFGQTMGAFKVKASPSGKIFLYAPIVVDGKTISYTLREFSGDTLKHVQADGQLHSSRDVLRYIDNH